MMNVQFFTTPAGEEMVILSRHEFESLANVRPMTEEEEDAADLAVYLERKAELKGDGSDILPVEVCAFMLKGDRRLRAIRKWRALSQASLAASAGLTQGYVSDLEARRRMASPETIDALAKALDVPREWLA